MAHKFPQHHHCWNALRMGRWASVGNAEVIQLFEIFTTTCAPTLFCPSFIRKCWNPSNVQEKPCCNQSLTAVFHRRSIYILSGLHSATLLPTACTVVSNRLPPQAGRTGGSQHCTQREKERGGISGSLAPLQKRNVSLGLCKLLRLCAVTGWRSQLSIPCSITLFDWHFNEGARGRPPARGLVHAPFISQSM